MAGRLLGEAWISVRPDTTLFGPDARAKITASLRGFTPAVKVAVDAKDLAGKGAKAAKAVQAGIKAGGPVNVKVGVDARGGLRTMADVRAMLKGMTDKVSALRFNIDEPGLLARATALNAGLKKALSDVKVDYDPSASAEARTIASAHALRKTLEGLLGEVGIDVELNDARVARGITKVRKELAGLKSSVKSITFNANDASAVAVIRTLKASIRDLTAQTYTIRTAADLTSFKDDLARAFARAQAVTMKLNPAVAPAPVLTPWAQGIAGSLQGSGLPELSAELGRLHGLAAQSGLPGIEAEFAGLQERLIALNNAMAAISSDQDAARASRQFLTLGDAVSALDEKLKPLPSDLARKIGETRNEVADLRLLLADFVSEVTASADKLALQKIANSASALHGGLPAIRTPQALDKAKADALALQVQFGKLRDSLTTPEVLHLDVTTALIDISKVDAQARALQERLATLSAHKVATGNVGGSAEIMAMSTALADLQRKAAALHATGVISASDVKEAQGLTDALTRLSGAMDALDGGIDKGTARWRGFINALADLTRTHIPLFNGALSKIRLPAFIASASGLHILTEAVIELTAIWGPAIAGAIAFGLAITTDVKGIVTQMTNMRTAFKATGTTADGMSKIFSGQLAMSLRPQVWTLFGEAITGANNTTGNFAKSMHQIAQVAVGLGQRLVDSLGNGNAFKKSASDIQGLGDAFASLGRIVRVFLKSVPGYADQLLKLGNAILSITANVLSAIQPLIGWGLKLHGAIFYLGLFATLLGTVGKSLVGGFQTGFKAATTEVTALGAASAGATGKVAALDAATMASGGSAKSVTAAVKEADGKVAGFGAAMGNMAGNATNLGSKLGGVEMSFKGIGGAAKSAGKNALGWIGSLVGLGPVAGGIMVVGAAVGFLAYKMATAQTAAQKFTASLETAVKGAAVSQFASLTAGNLTQVQQHLASTGTDVQQWARKWEGATGQSIQGTVSATHAMALLNQASKALVYTGKGAAGVQAQQRNALVVQAKSLTSDLAVYQQAMQQAQADQAKFNQNLNLLAPIAGSAANALGALTVAGVTNGQMLDTSAGNQKYLKGIVASVTAGYQAMTSGIGGANTALQTLNITTSAAYTTVQQLTGAYSTFLGIVTGSASAFATFEQQFLTIAQATGKAIPGASTATQAALNAASGGAAPAAAKPTVTNTTSTTQSAKGATSTTRTTSTTAKGAPAAAAGGGGAGGSLKVTSKGKVSGNIAGVSNGTFGGVSTSDLAALTTYIQQLQSAQQLFAALQTQAAVSGNSPLAQFALGRAGKDIVAQLAAIPGIGKNKETTAMLSAVATQTGFKPATANVGSAANFQAIVKWAGSATKAEGDLNKQQQILTVTSANLAADAAALSNTMTKQLAAAMAQAIFNAEGGQKALDGFAKAISGVKDKAHPTSAELTRMRAAGLNVAKMLMTMTGNAQAAKQQFETFMGMQGVSVKVADQLWASYHLGAAAIGNIANSARSAGALFTGTFREAFATATTSMGLTRAEAGKLWTELGSTGILKDLTSNNLPAAKGAFDNLRTSMHLSQGQAQTLWSFLQNFAGANLKTTVVVDVGGAGTIQVTATAPQVPFANTPAGQQAQAKAAVFQSMFTVKKAGGIMTVPGGWGGGDQVPAMLEPGELIVPKRAVPPFASLAKRLGIPGFAVGGVASAEGAMSGSYTFAQQSAANWTSSMETAYIQDALAAVRASVNTAQAAQQAKVAAAAAGRFTSGPAATGSAAAAQAFARSILPAGWSWPALLSLWNQECLTLDSRILTRRGWLAHDEVHPGDETIGYNSATGRSEWTAITRVVHYDDAEVWRIGGSRWHADVTPGHRWWSDHRKDNGRGYVTERAGFTRTADLARGDRIRLSAVADTDGIPGLSADDAAILAWMQGDGCIRPARNGQAYDGRIYQSKPAQVIRLRALLAHTEYTERVYRSTKGQPEHVFLLRRGYVTDLVKRAEVAETGPEQMVLRMSPGQRAAWLSAMTDAEGTAKGRYTIIYQNPGPLAEAIQLAVYLEGYRPGVRHNSRDRVQATGMGNPHVAVHRFREPEVLARQPVWCCTTTLGSLTARQGDFLFLTGNSGWNANAVNPGSGAYGIPQCVPLRTKILTRRGWLAHDEVRTGDETIGYNLKTGHSEWTRVTAVHHTGVMPVWRFGDARWAVESTPEHRWLAEKEIRRGEPGPAAFVRLRDKRARHRVILAREADTGPGLPVTTSEAALLAWISGDGWERKPYARYGDTRGGGTPRTFHVSQAKQECWPLIEAALADVPHSVVRTRNGHREWRLSAPYARDLAARAGNPKTDALAQVLAMSPEQRNAWLSAIIAAEGSTAANGSVRVSQCEGPVADAIIAAIYLSGNTASIYKDERYERTCLTIGITRDRLGRADHRGAFTEPAGHAEAWCVSTLLGSWSAEQDGQVFLTGNSLGHGHPYNLGDYANQIRWGIAYIAQRYGNSQAAWAHEQCVPLDTEILTRRGWLRHGELRAGDETIGWNSQAARSEWTPVQGVTVYDDVPLVTLSNKTWTATCTPGHRWAAVHWRQRKGGAAIREDVLVETRGITSRHSLRVAASAETGQGPAISEQEAELLGWVLGDGSVARIKSKPGSDPAHWRTGTGSLVSIRLYQAKPGHVKLVDDLVEGLLFNRMTRHMRTPAGNPGLPLVTWEFTRGYSAELLKRSGYDHKDPVPFVLSLSQCQRQAFMRGVFGAEGTLTGNSGAFGTPKGTYALTRAHVQNDGAQQDAIILALYLEGHRPALTERDNRGVQAGRWTCATVAANIREAKPFIGGEKIRRADAGRAPAFCPQTALGTWTMRQGRNVMLTGNSHNWYNQGGIAGMAGGGMAPGSHLSAVAHFASGGKTPLATAYAASAAAKTASEAALKARTHAENAIGHNLAITVLPHLYGLGAHRTASGITAEQQTYEQLKDTAYQAAFTKYTDARSAYDALLPKPKAKVTPKPPAKAAARATTTAFRNSGKLDLASLRAAFAHHDMTAAQQHAWHLLHDKHVKKHATGGIINEPVTGFGVRSGMPYSFAESRAEKVTPVSPASAGGMADSGAQLAALLHRQNQLLEKQNQLLAQQPVTLSRALSGAVGQGMYRS